MKIQYFSMFITRRGQICVRTLKTERIRFDYQIYIAKTIVILCFPEKTHDELARIARWLMNSGYHTDYMQVYAAIRSNSIVKTIEKYVFLCLRIEMQSSLGYL